MPSDWPNMFFGELGPKPTHAALLAKAEAQTNSAPKVETIRRSAPVPKAVPAGMPAQGQKWPNLFFGEAAARQPQAQPAFSTPPIPQVALQQSPVVTARIQLPSQTPVNDLPSITLPPRKRVELPPNLAKPAAPPSPTPIPAAAAPARSAKPGSLLLTNGETVSGIIVAETPDAIFLQSEILGVLTVPKSAIASRFIQLNLSNGDYIAGDLIADTAEMLLVRSPVLGTVTVPRHAVAR